MADRYSDIVPRNLTRPRRDSMAQAAWPLVERKFGQTSRRDTWWVQPLLTFLGLSAFVVYSTWAAFQGEH